MGTLVRHRYAHVDELNKIGFLQETRFYFLTLRTLIVTLSEAKSLATQNSETPALHQTQCGASVLRFAHAEGVTVRNVSYLFFFVRALRTAS